MGQARHIALVVTLLLAMIYTASGQSYRVLPPGTSPSPYGSIGVPNPPPMPLSTTEKSRLKSEYKNLRVEYQKLDKQLTIQKSDIDKTKEKIRKSSTSVGKWMARRDLQQQIEDLNQIYTRMDEIDERMHVIQQINPDNLPNHLNKPLEVPYPGPTLNPPPGPPAYRIFKDRRYVAPETIRTPLPDPNDDIPVLPGFQSLSREEQRNRLERLREENTQLKNRSTKTSEEIRRMEESIKRNPPGRTAPNSPHP